MRPLLFLCAALSFAQTPVMTFGGEGAESLRSATGKVLSGVQLVHVTACNATAAPITFSGGAIYQGAAANGFSVIGPNDLRLMLTRTASLNWRSTTAKVLPIIAGTGTALLASKTVKFSADVQPRMTAAGAILTTEFAILQSFISGRAPDPTTTLANLIDASGSQFLTYSLAPGQCLDGKIGAKYMKATK